ncbi:hypothetical protein P7K49_004605, partial [Saguinus oedipus]
TQLSKIFSAPNYLPCSSPGRARGITVSSRGEEQPERNTTGADCIHLPTHKHFIKSLQEYHVVGPVRVDASGHFLSYGLHHLITSSRRKRDLDGSEDWVYYKISHEEKDLFFNLTVNRRFLSNSYIMEKRYGNLSNVKMMASSAPLCHLSGTVLQQGTRVGTAALSACHGLVSVGTGLPSSAPSPRASAGRPTTNRFTDAMTYGN